MAEVGTVYLLHFADPLGHAQHYLGWALDHLDRVNAHLAGKGAALVRAAVRRGIHVELVRTWEGADRTFERRIKRRGTLKQVCPICLPEYNERKAARMRRVRAQRREQAGQV